MNACPGIAASKAGTIRRGDTVRMRIDVGGAGISSRSRQVACNSADPTPETPTGLRESAGLTAMDTLFP